MCVSCSLRKTGTCFLTQFCTNWRVGLHKKTSLEFCNVSYLVRVDNQRRPPVELLHLLGRHKVSHAHGLPALLVLPQHCVQSGQQCSDVSLLPLDPVQDLHRTTDTLGPSSYKWSTSGTRLTVQRHLPLKTAGGVRGPYSGKEPFLVVIFL